MPKGPQGQKRPADTFAGGVMVGRIATGEVTEKLADKDPAAVALGKKGGAKGGRVRAKNMSPAKRKAAASKAAKARWGRK